MKYLPFILILFASCNPCARIWRRCPPIIVDSIRVDSIVRLDTITLLYPGDTVRIGEETLKGFGIIIETDKQKVTHKKGYTEFICKEDSLNAIISVLKYQLTNTKTFVKEKIVYLPQKYVPPIYKWSFWILIGLIIFSGAYLYVSLKINLPGFRR